ncbi:vegetative cell wall protein gp1-like [Phragmites australis]|uniref:vegetative cell wall protein gp1-like n=1 Tax=Phragmites australis TaxID=29695 RepID=UPI002D7886FC|nr:vegetative cell wall protein gp1-like [Phragmites australis]
MCPPRPPLHTPLPHTHTATPAARRQCTPRQAILCPPALAATRARRPKRGQQRMARTLARGRLLLVGLAVLVLHHAACATPAAAALRASAISAAPEYPLPRLPRQHHSHLALPPALSPDIMPVLPSPADDGAAVPPSEAVPTIPSSPSPPNPDALEPNSAFAPYGYAPAVAAQSPAPAPPRAAASVAWALPVGLLAMWLV